MDDSEIIEHLTHCQYVQMYCGPCDCGALDRERSRIHQLEAENARLRAFVDEVERAVKGVTRDG